MVTIDPLFWRILSLLESSEGSFCFRVLFPSGTERRYLVEFFRCQLREMPDEVD